jgi:hypothetical protein
MTTPDDKTIPPASKASSDIPPVADVTNTADAAQATPATPLVLPGEPVNEPAKPTLADNPNFLIAIQTTLTKLPEDSTSLRFFQALAKIENDLDAAPTPEQTALAAAEYFDRLNERPKIELVDGKPSLEQVVKFLGDTTHEEASALQEISNARISRRSMLGSLALATAGGALAATGFSGLLNNIANDEGRIKTLLSSVTMVGGIVAATTGLVIIQEDIANTEAEIQKNIDNVGTLPELAGRLISQHDELLKHTRGVERAIAEQVNSSGKAATPGGAR